MRTAVTIPIFSGKPIKSTVIESVHFAGSANGTGAGLGQVARIMSCNTQPYRKIQRSISCWIDARYPWAPVMLDPVLNLPGPWISDYSNPKTKCQPIFRHTQMELRETRFHEKSSTCWHGESITVETNTDVHPTRNAQQL